MQINDETVTVPVEVEHTATVPVEAVEPAEPELDPNRLIEADVQLQREEQETERARIAARTAVRIAQIEAEGEPPEWQNAIQECLTRLTALETMMVANQQSSIPTQSTVVVTEPEAPIVEETTLEAPPEESVEVTPEPNEAREEVPAPARPRRRWI